MDDTAATPTVRDDTGHHRFVIDLDGHAAELVYRRPQPDRLRLVHTEVPAELGGRGLGGVLVRGALDVARREQLTIEPECEFARGWLEKHPDDTAGITIDWDQPA